MSLPPYAKNIIKLREHNGLSQSDLCAASGITQQAISLYESGKRRPKLSTLASLAKSLNCTVYDIDPETMAMYPKELKALNARWKKLDRKKQEKILSQIKRIIG